MNHDIAARRLRNQAITGKPRRNPGDVVSWLGAVQAQEYGPAKWAIALRMTAGARVEGVERALDAGRILRTHVMRPTWHFVPRDDIRWMLELTAPRVHRLVAPSNRRLELDARTLARAAAIVERSLGGGRFLTRAELAGHLAAAGIRVVGQRLAHVVMYAELEGVICSGPRRGGQFTYALLAERAPGARRVDRDEGLAMLARRFLRSHGPATVRDFVWWSGLLTADAARAFAIVKARSEAVGGITYWSVEDAAADAGREHAAHLLPVYDEYLVAYRDRAAVPHRPPGMAEAPGRQAALLHPLIVNGQVAGSWRPVRIDDAGRIDVAVAARLRRAERDAVHAAAQRYAAAVGLRMDVHVR